MKVSSGSGKQARLFSVNPENPVYLLTQRLEEQAALLPDRNLSPPRIFALSRAFFFGR